MILKVKIVFTKQFLITTFSRRRRRRRRFSYQGHSFRRIAIKQTIDLVSIFSQFDI